MDKFLHFKSSEFAQEASFINWVTESNVSDINLWNEWIANHPEKRKVIEEAKVIVNAIKFEQEQIDPNLEDKIWKKINAATQSQSVTTEISESSSGMVRILKRWVPLAAAAIIALLVYVNLSNDTGYDTNLQTTFAQNEQALLPDGSIIDINAESKVAYSKAKWDDNREINLEGEAYFSVKKGSKFTVVTNNGNVEVLGTSFNVFSRGDLFSVECETGKVSVTADGKEIILTPNEGIKIDLAENEVFKTEVSAKRSSWRRGSYSYKDVELQEVLNDIERHFDAKLIGVDLPSTQPYTGNFSATNIDSVLHRVCWPLNLEVSKSSEGYRISAAKK